jgi:hypothetical protein
MADKKELIQGSVPKDLKKLFNQQVQGQGFIIGRVVESMTRLWTELPADIQSKLYGRQVDGPALINLVRQIADEQIQADRKAKTVVQNAVRKARKVKT